MPFEDLSLDKRLTPARPDLAAERLRGVISAQKYVSGKTRSVMAAFAPMTRKPCEGATLDTVLLYGERMSVYEARDGWLWGQSELDGYVGYTPAAAFGGELLQPTHIVTALASHLYHKPDIKAQPVGALYMGSQVRITETEGRFLRMSDGLFMARSHLHSLQKNFDDDYLSVAERFIGTPYLWGGKTASGIDCSGLVQIAMHCCGFEAPRDSDMQEKLLGHEVDLSNTTPERGDLVFWPGHVGLMLDRRLLLHANAYHMAVAKEPLVAASQRIRIQEGAKISSVRRVDPAMSVPNLLKQMSFQF